ncbi:uncharacterized protein LY89DRAFT_147579 [Mollisia scopiformis]|uniref:Uncharacterized protein n=1 Tax=Mollisia scopiformis TaxID=149040 RepID=A0A194X0T3_MOLSC|nr:uncharacterized protein LY89DRAFT_147579 [Mollisia scopiformis]KUJ13808.1 hypothetical protein LY89DRAFT_147579 [Mollisia scopiformis]
MLAYRNKDRERIRIQRVPQTKKLRPLLYVNFVWNSHFFGGYFVCVSNFFGGSFWTLKLVVRFCRVRRPQGGLLQIKKEAFQPTRCPGRRGPGK